MILAPCLSHACPPDSLQHAYRPCLDIFSLSLRPACLPACLPARYVHSNMFIPICSFCLLACPPTRLLAYLPAFLPTCLPACLPACLPTLIFSACLLAYRYLPRFHVHFMSAFASRVCLSCMPMRTTRRPETRPTVCIFVVASTTKAPPWIIHARRALTAQHRCGALAHICACLPASLPCDACLLACPDMSCLHACLPACLQLTSLLPLPACLP